MKRTCLAVSLLLSAAAAPAHAQFIDGALSAAAWAQEQAYEAFMKLQVLQEVATLKANYEASVRYYNEFKQLNSGRGFVYNVGQQIAKTEDQTVNQISQSLTNAIANKGSYGQLLQTIDKAVAGNMQYASSELANLGTNRQMAIQVSQNANGLSPKDAANLAAKAQGLQMQMLAEIHEDNLRLLQMQALQLSNANQHQENEATMIQSLKQSLQTRGVVSGGN